MESKEIDFSGIEKGRKIEDLKLECPVEGIIDTISKKWSLLTINSLGNHGKLRYSEIKKELRGVSSKTLSMVLKELEDNGLIQRKVMKGRPPIVEYSLTDDGIQLRKAIVPLIAWATSRSDNERCPMVSEHSKIS